MTKKAFRPDVDAPEWKGGHTPYDIIKEGTIALLVVALVTLLLAVIFGSPDEAAITIKKWSNAAPVDFATTALSELNGTSHDRFVRCALQPQRNESRNRTNPT